MDNTMLTATEDVIDMNQRLIAAREKYRPQKFKLIFVTMAPPHESTDRHFYYEDVYKHDSNFLEIMKVLYPRLYDSYGDTPEVRLHKAEFLERFRDDGYYLLEAKDTPIIAEKSRERERELREALPSLVKALRILKANRVPLVLIYEPVFIACTATLRRHGYNVINDEPIAAGQGHQDQFRRELQMLLNKHRLLPMGS